MGRLFRRIALLAVLGGIAAAISQRFMRRDECTPTCQCSLGAASCDWPWGRAAKTRSTSSSASGA